MREIANIPLLNETRERLRLLTYSQAAAMLASGEAGGVYERVVERWDPDAKCVRREPAGQLLRLVLRGRTRGPEASNSRNDAATITMGDIQAAANADDMGATRRERYEAARIAVWPEIHDTRAIVVGPRV